jgi:hypothetical protein
MGVALWGELFTDLRSTSGRLWLQAGSSGAIGPTITWATEVLRSSPPRKTWLLRARTKEKGTPCPMKDIGIRSPVEARNDHCVAWAVVRKHPEVVNGHVLGNSCCDGCCGMDEVLCGCQSHSLHGGAGGDRGKRGRRPAGQDQLELSEARARTVCHQHDELLRPTGRDQGSATTNHVCRSRTHDNAPFFQRLPPSGLAGPRKVDHRKPVSKTPRSSSC